MKKGPLHFLGRKNQSLFDTNVKMKEMDNVELVLQPSAIPESGTASVRARPTVKHLTSSSLDSFQGFAVPTPTVPLLPPVNGARVNGSDNLSNGSVVSLPDHVPPPPTMAPPPPPGTFIPPPPEFIYDPDLQHLQPPRLPAPKPPTAFPSMQEEDFSFLQPPQMAPPRPPSVCSSGSASTLSASSLPSDPVPERPKYAAPQPPSERQPKMKMPPPKPIRLSSISTSDSPPPTPAPPPPVQKPTPSTFNPQNTAKLYDVPKMSILSRPQDRSPKPTQLLLLEDSPALVQVDGKPPPKFAPAAKPVPEEEKKHNLNVSQGSPSAAPELKKETGSESEGAARALQSQELHKVSKPLLPSGGEQPRGAASPTGKFSPLLDRKLRNLKGGESGGSREAAAASPLTLLMAAKEREKQRSGQSSQGNAVAAKMRSGSSILTSKSIREERNIQAATAPVQPRPAVLGGRTQPPSTNGLAQPSAAANLATQQQTPKVDHQDGKEELSMPLLPPPPEFGDTDELMEPPPELPPPDPPRKTTQLPHPSLKPKPPQAPKLPPLQTKVRPKPPAESDLVPSPPPPLPSPPPPLSPSQATLLSILQKKMLEMDHKMAPVKEAEAGQDDWNSPLSEEDEDVPVVPKATGQRAKNPGLSRAGLDLQELEDKASTTAIRNGSSSRHQYGCTFTVRPGSKQPITVVHKGAS